SDEGAERYYRHCLALRPDYIDALYCLGQVLAALDKTEEAAEYFCKALEQTTSVQEMIAIAVEFSAIGMADQAIRVYFAGLIQEPDNYYLYSNIGIELAEQRDFEDAVFCHEKALQMDENNADLWYNAACTYSLMGEAMRGLLALEKSILLDDENRNYALQDPELEFLQKHKRFWKLVKANEPKE
ncbi:MAG: tetratricopeptide repeat protein, partial [Peptococcaceae bacterium]|nr:tetratricopeptide repeat protein [Peptococcaceae bacterium]